MSRRIALALVSALSLAAACNPLEFEDRREEASTVALAPPDDYPNTGFGQVVVGYGGDLGGVYQSRVGGTAGADTPYTVYPLLIGEEVRLDTPVVDGCDEEAPCMTGAGVSLVGLLGWGDRELCVAATAPESGEIKIRCEDDVTRFVTVGGPGAERFGLAGAGLREEHPIGRAIFGAPGASAGVGAVYRLPDASPPEPIDLSADAGVSGELGRAVAVDVIDADTALVVAGAPSGATKRVIVATVEVATDGTVTPEVRGCLDDSTAGWGEVLAAGDLNGDGVPDVAVGYGLEEDRASVVRVYDGAALPAACGDAWEPAVELGCPSVEAAGCDDASGFGQTLAIGDLDGDGVGDLLVGAPAATVGEVGGAGAVFAFRGGDLGSLGSTERVAAMRHSDPGTGARLGAALAVAPGLDDGAGTRRDEAVVGAPGADRIYVFLCSGLEGDSPANTEGMRCQPREL